MAEYCGGPKHDENFVHSLMLTDIDSDSAFMNQTVFDYCAREHLEFTRSRAYKKNNQAGVEQKNGAIVRRLTPLH